MSFNVEALGFGVGEALPGPVLAPPSLFPPLTNPPVALRGVDGKNSSFSGKVDWDYCVMVKKQLVDWMWDASPFVSCLGPSGDFGRATARAPGVADVERYSDRYQLPQVSGNQKESTCFDWTRFPKELRPGKEGDTGASAKGSAGGNKRKRKAEKGGAALAPKKDIAKRFAELEQREVQGKDGADEEEGEDATREKGEEKRKGGEEGGGDEEGAEGEEGEEEEEEDEEMDDGTDYISSYFDNGERYLDDDDDGDDGPTY